MFRRILGALIALILFAGCSNQPAVNITADPIKIPDVDEGDQSGPGQGLAWDPVIHRFSVKPATVPPGGKATLSWQVSNADSVSINQNIGQVEKTGMMEVSPSVQTVYIITATNVRGSTFAKVTLTISDHGANKLPVIEEFKSVPEILKKDVPARLLWKTSGATLVLLNNVPVQLSGDKMIRQMDSTTYILTVTNSFGSDIKYLSVPVSE